MFYLLSWLVALEMIGLIAFLNISKYYPNLADRGFSFSKPLAMITLAFISWLLCIWGLAKPNQLTLYLIMTLFIFTLIFNKTYISSLRSTNSSLWKNILVSEIIFISVFTIFALIKFLDPSINHTEQPMDFAFLNASINSPTGGPLDPWMSGHSISYYYFGYWIFGVMSNISSVPSSYAYNLALISIPALSASAIYGIFASIIGSKITTNVRPIFVALFGSVIALNFIGNLYAMIAFFRDNSVGGEAFWQFVCLDGLTPLENSSTLSWYPTDFWWWFKGTRIINYFGENCAGPGIDYTISEFPFFSYILGDLHPHVMVIPFFISAILIIISSTGVVTRNTENMKLVIPSLFVGMLIAGCSFINLWSMPVCITIYLGIIGLSVFVNTDTQLLKKYGVHVLITFFTTSLLLAPYLLEFQSSFTGLQRSEVQTRLIHGLIIWAPLFLINIPYVIQMFFKVPISLHWRKTLFISILICTIPWIIRSLLPGTDLPNGPNMIQWAWPISGVSLIALISGINLYKYNGLTGGVLALLSTVLSLTLILIPELFYLGDPYNNRMNTVFKFYQHAWILMSISSGYVLFSWTRTGLPRIAKKQYINWPIYAIGSLIILSGSYYSAAMLTVKSSESNQQSLDGLAYLPADVIAAIKFAQKNISVENVILESVGEWDESGIISRSTGIPNIINWPGHQGQWRGHSEEIDERILAVETIYSSPDVEIRKQLLNKFNVSYVYVGINERRIYTPEQLSKFELFGQTIFYNEMGIKIFKIE